MTFDLTMVTANAIIIVPIVIALTQAVKMTGFIPDHFAPLLSIGIGIIIGFLADHGNEDLTSSLLNGAVYGLLASGLYSGVKTTMMAHMRIKAERQRKQANQNNSQNNGNKGNC